MHCRTRITVRELLAHTSGIALSSGRRHFADADDSPEALERAVRSLGSERPVHAPGEAFQYSNANYQVLGAIIEAVSGKSYAAYVEQEVFRPLGMSHSFADGRRAVVQGAAVGSRYWFGHPVPFPDAPSPRSLEPVGELYVSADDMGAYLSMLLEGGRHGSVRVLSEDATRALFVSAATRRNGGGYALGWFTEKDAVSFAVWHDGSTPNFHAHVALDLPTHRAFALFVNAETSLSDPPIRDLGFRIVSILRGERAEPVERSAVPLRLLALIVIAAVQLAGFATWVRRSRVKRPGVARASIAIAVHLAFAAGLLFWVPRLERATWRAILVFAPDAGWFLLANAGIAVIWACARAAALLR